MINEKVRIALLKNKCPQWKLARLVGVSETTIVRRLREELPEEDQDEYVRLIEEECGKNG